MGFKKAHSSNFVNNIYYDFENSCFNENLDGELWLGRQAFQSMGVVRRLKPDPKEWIPVIYIVYDLPNHKGTFHERIIRLQEIVEETKERWNELKKEYPIEFQIDCPLQFAEQVTVESEEHMKEMYNDIINHGGEGIILKDPKSYYEGKRSKYMLKFKPSFEEESVIVGY